MAQETQTGVLYQPRGMGREMGERFKREGRDMGVPMGGSC